MESNVRQVKMQPEEISIEAICEGDALREANEKLKRIVQDIQDPRKKIGFKRELKIHIKITPTMERSIDEIEFHIQEKLAPYTPQKPERWCDGL